MGIGASVALGGITGWKPPPPPRRPRARSGCDAPKRPALPSSPLEALLGHAGRDGERAFESPPSASNRATHESGGGAVAEKAAKSWARCLRKGGRMHRWVSRNYGRSLLRFVRTIIYMHYSLQCHSLKGKGHSHNTCCTEIGLSPGCVSAAGKLGQK